MKMCNKCNKIKVLDDFYKSKIHKEGRRSECKECQKQYRRNTYYKRAAREVAYNKVRKYERYHSDVNFKLAHSLRTRLGAAINNNQKVGSAVDDLGCSVEELKKHLECQFKEGMSWDNWTKDGWHIDHIKPLANFDLTKEEELKKACHYTNLQPMWAKENQSKGSKDE